MKATAKIILFLLLAVLYILVPLDIIPDRLGRVGRLDDFFIAFTVIYWFFFKPFIDDLRGKTNSNAEKEKPSDEKKPAPPWQILGVSKNAGTEEIKKAYHDKIRQYHPDLVNKMGPEIQKVAANESRKINQAFAQLQKTKKN
jgi:uncharacterized membrane protein YkvA (DUF1232 family)